MGKFASMTPLNELKPNGGKIGTISEQDQQHIKIIRANVSSFVARMGKTYGLAPARLLDIAPQDHEGARPHFPEHVVIETLDINPQAGTTYVGDVCKLNPSIPNEAFDLIVCTEVLEHTLEPWCAPGELKRMMKPGGYLFVSVPFNFRIHGPIPDCWRFTEYGLRTLFKDWEIVELVEVDTPGRFLMPIHYTLVCRKPLTAST